MRILINTTAITMMTENKEITRKDILTGNVYPRSKLTRLVLRDNEILIDKNNSLSGRGAYLLAIESSYQKLSDGRLLSKAFHTYVDTKMASKLLEDLKNGR